MSEDPFQITFLVVVCHRESACLGPGDTSPSPPCPHSGDDKTPLTQAELFPGRALMHCRGHPAPMWSPGLNQCSSLIVLAAFCLECQVIIMYNCCKVNISIKIIVFSKAVEWMLDESAWIIKHADKNNAFQPLISILKSWMICLVGSDFCAVSSLSLV